MYDITKFFSPYSTDSHKQTTYNSQFPGFVTQKNPDDVLRHPCDQQYVLNECN